MSINGLIETGKNLKYLKYVTYNFIYGILDVDPINKHILLFLSVFYND